MNSEFQMQKQISSRCARHTILLGFIFLGLNFKPPWIMVGILDALKNEATEVLGLLEKLSAAQMFFLKRKRVRSSWRIVCCQLRLAAKQPYGVPMLAPALHLPKHNLPPQKTEEKKDIPN